MDKTEQIHLIIGFWLIFLASCGGFFLADQQLDSFRQQRPEQLLSWWMVLSSSAHGHTALFGVLHILTGLTLPYGCLRGGWKVLQGSGLVLGSFAMSVLMMIRSFYIPDQLFDPMGILIGICLSCALGSVALHIVGLSVHWLYSPQHKLNR